jgi:hypothetical protein
MARVKKRVGTGDGGCYGSSGPVAIQWRRAKDNGASNDAETVKVFAKSLPPGSMLRHHVVGDMGGDCLMLLILAFVIIAAVWYFSED